MVRIKEVRSRRGYTQQDVAFRSGLSLRTIARLEQPGAGGQTATIERIARALGVPVSDLYDEDVA